MGLLSRASSAAGGIANCKAVEKAVERTVVKETVPLESEIPQETEASLEEIVSTETEAPVDAVQGNDFTLDEMGKALRERLKSLPQKKSTPYTVLSLLKAYGAFQTGICLSLKNGSYSSYASIGLAIEKLSIPQGEIWSAEKGRERYFKLDPQFKIENAEKDSGYWVFPLDSSQPWGAVMLLGAQNSQVFDPEPVSVLLTDVTGKLLVQTNQNAVEPDSDETTPQNTTEPLNEGKSNTLTLEEEIVLFHRTYLDFSCIVLENSEGKPDFCEKISAILDKTGTVLPLPLGHSLILLPLVIDRELIVHRLSKVLNTKVILSFEANNPENVFTRLDSLI